MIDDVEGSIARGPAEAPHGTIDQIDGEPGAGQGAARRLLPHDLVDGNALEDRFQGVGDRHDSERDLRERGADEEGGLFGLRRWSRRLG